MHILFCRCKVHFLLVVKVQHPNNGNDNLYLHLKLEGRLAKEEIIHQVQIIRVIRDNIGVFHNSLQNIGYSNVAWFSIKGRSLNVLRFDPNLMRFRFQIYLKNDYAVLWRTYSLSTLRTNFYFVIFENCVKSKCVRVATAAVFCFVFFSLCGTSGASLCREAWI